MMKTNCIKIEKPVLDMKATGEKIKSLRKLNKIPVSALQEIFGMANPQAIYNWESGKNMPSIDNLLILAQIFNVSVETLVITYKVDVEIGYRDITALKSA